MKTMLRKRRASSPYQMMLDYRNYLRQKKLNKLSKKEKNICQYKELKLAFTPKQIEVLRLIAEGFSNAKIAQKLGTKENTVKLLIYRLMKSMEGHLHESIDRFSLIIIAQQLELEYLSVVD